jgi:hypothetical protein
MTEMDSPLIGLTEDELDALVSIAIRRAEILEEMKSPKASDAWSEVMIYEARLSEITRPDEIPGGVARAGAVTAALAAGRRTDASRLASRYLAEPELPAERRVAIQRAFEEDQERLAQRFPALSRSGRLAELAEWRAVASRDLHVFPRAA